MLHACYIIATCEHISLLHIFHKEKEALLLLNKKKIKIQKREVYYPSKPFLFLAGFDFYPRVYRAVLCVSCQRGRDACIVKMFVCLYRERETEREREITNARWRGFHFFKKIRVVESEKETTPEGTNIS